jgi:selenocysteine lyase/cysteine desulfurase
MPPIPVVKAVGQGYERISKSPVEGKLALQKIIKEEALPNLAKLMAAKPDELSLTRNASEALHLAARGLKLNPIDEVVITSQEHPAGRQPWKYRESHHDLVLKEVFIPSPLPATEDIIQRIERSLSPKTKAIAFCHVTRGGHLYPVREICTWAKGKGLVTLVDGAQAVGMVPVDLTAMGCDAYSTCLHKWMLAPLGTGFLYIRSQSRDYFESLYDPDSTKEMPNYDPTGSVDLPLRAAIGTTLDFYLKLGADAIEGRLRFLSDYLKEQLKSVSGYRPLSGSLELSAPGSTIFELEGIEPIAALDGLEAKGIFIDEHVRDGHKAFRISTHYFNSASEIDRVVHVLKSIK